MKRALSVALLAAAVLASASASQSEAPPFPIAGVDAAPGLRPWRYLGPNPDGWWCRPGRCRVVRNGTVFVDREAPLIAKLGVKIVRVDFPWAFIELRQGRYDWSRADYIVKRLRHHSLEVHAVLSYTPSWAGATMATPPNPARFAAF